MATKVGKYDPPKSKSPMAEYPKFLFRTKARVAGTRGGFRYKAMWLCSCGKEFEAQVQNVTTGHTKSCGCFAAASRKMAYPKHGHFLGGKPSLTYKSWQAMIARCTNPKHPAFDNYGGRGITIDPRWAGSFDVFLADMGERPAGYVLDRIDNYGGYCKSNCRWVTVLQSGGNRRDVRMIVLDGQRISLMDAWRSRPAVVSSQTFRKRIVAGWDVELALTTPSKSR